MSHSADFTEVGASQSRPSQVRWYILHVLWSLGWLIWLSVGVVSFGHALG
ncbi:hypothetical protein SAMN05444166_0191 [Singulisphaera sp. GP187]|nr:hypothetical protein [Singulisphaera sp. GP187]SIN69616.1 hypothetical protein SAMN05444166_0191 [Singulisphaera sp. GP187]